MHYNSAANTLKKFYLFLRSEGIREPSSHSGTSHTVQNAPSRSPKAGLIGATQPFNNAIYGLALRAGQAPIHVSAPVWEGARRLRIRRPLAVWTLLRRRRSLGAAVVIRDNAAGLFDAHIAGARHPLESAQSAVVERQIGAAGAAGSPCRGRLRAHAGAHQDERGNSG